MRLDCGLDLLAYLKTEGHTIRDMEIGAAGRVYFDVDIDEEGLQGVKRRWMVSRERGFLHCYHDLQGMVREVRGDNRPKRAPVRGEPHQKVPITAGHGELRQKLPITPEMVRIAGETPPAAPSPGVLSPDE